MIDEVMRTAATRAARRGCADGAVLEEQRALLEGLLRRWGLVVEGIYGGVGFPVLAVCREDGERAVLKLGADAVQIRVLQSARGRGYARVLAADAEAGAVLTEKLGGRLGDSRLRVVDQARVAARILADAWAVPMDVAERLPDGKAAGLLRLLHELGPLHPTYDAAVGQAVAVAMRLARDEVAEVTCHGDPHPDNCLQRGASWAFVDPDSFAGERAYDLGVVLRNFNREMLAAEAYRPGAGTTLLRAVCSALAGESGVEAARIWDWGFVERVTTGLFLHRLGYAEDGDVYLDVAMRLVGVEPA